jgi:hypothetical protein
MRILGVTASGFDTGAYELISTTILGSAQSSVVFDVSSYTSTYKHLQIRVVTRTDRGANEDILGIRFNGDTGSNYITHLLAVAPTHTFTQVLQQQETTQPTLSLGMLLIYLTLIQQAKIQQ